VIAEVSLGSDFERLYGAPYLVIHRADLHRVLLSRAYAGGVKIQLNTFVSVIDEAEPAVTLGDGQKLGADLVIGADGTSSLCVVLSESSVSL
jgi:salicylate hydroxylase